MSVQIKCGKYFTRTSARELDKQKDKTINKIKINKIEIKTYPDPTLTSSSKIANGLAGFKIAPIDSVRTGS